MSKNLLASCFIKEEKFKPKALGGNTEITIRELSIDETEKYLNILQEENQKDAIRYAVKCSMVEPKFFSDEELKKINATGQALIIEVFNEIPLIGKTKKEREDYFQKIKTITENQITESAEEVEEKEQKK